MAYSPDNQNRQRLIILCFDGTTNEFDDDNTNVVKIFRMLEKNQRDKQILYYQTGIGTSANPAIWMPGVKHAAVIIDKMVANSLGQHVRAGYKFLQQQYTAGDKIAMFGFSRGAYVARGLAAMLKRVGLSQTGNDSFVDLAYRIYTGREDKDKDVSAYMAKSFMKTFSFENLKVDYLGLFDSVSSVGAFIPRYLPFTVNNEIVMRVAHAVALDERRTQFGCARWNHGFDVELFPPGYKKERSLAQTVVEEVFFAGAHVDVGGGQMKDWAANDLANISLRWMIRDAEKSGVGFIWNEAGRKLLDEYDDEITARDRAAQIDSGSQARNPSRQGSLVVPTMSTDDGLDQAEREAKALEKLLEHEKQVKERKRQIRKDKINSLECVPMDKQDALQEVHDPLEWQWSLSFILSTACLWTLFWWLLECLPLKKERYYVPRARDHEVPKMAHYSTWMPNFWRPRVLVRSRSAYPIKVHRSVKFRMERSRYRPRTKLPHDVEWVD